MRVEEVFEEIHGLYRGHVRKDGKTIHKIILEPDDIKDAIEAYLHVHLPDRDHD